MKKMYNTPRTSLVNLIETTALMAASASLPINNGSGDDPVDNFDDLLSKGSFWNL